MQRQYPMTQVSLLGGYPENGFPASGFYGVDSTLATMQNNTASSGNSSASPAQVEMPNMRTLVVAFLAIVGSVALWHFYMR